MNPHLRQFAQQLKDWTQQIIEFGRTPFRRVDCFFSVTTDAGPVEIPLLLWINKQSMMAGGILLLPESEKELDDELRRGRNCATALGLSHFVTWESTRVRLWHTDEDNIIEHQSFQLPGTDHPEYFRLLLGDIVDALKVPAVTGAIVPERLPACYFTNLFRITLDIAQPEITEDFRSQRVDASALPAVDIDLLAKEANRLLLLKVLWFVRSDRCPETMLPEQLEEHINSALDKAPEPWHTNFGFQWPLAPPHHSTETTVCYHHLFLRLQQLKWQQDTKRADDSILQLIICWYGDNSKPVAQGSVLHPEVPVTAADTQLLLSNSPLLIAATTLMRELNTRPQPLVVYGSMFELQPGDLKSKTISARCLNAAPIPASERPILSAKLRLSWPHRLLKISSDYPYWRGELLHLLGLVQPEQILYLETPRDILALDADDPIWNILETQYRILEIQAQNHTGIIITTIKAAQEGTTALIQHSGVTSELSIKGGGALKDQILSIMRPPTDAAVREAPHRQNSDGSAKRLRQKLSDQLVAHGIPNFPDQYFYYLESPRMQLYEITPPLRQVAHILGRFELEDAAGQTLTGYGEELKTSLLLCAQAGKSRFELPTDREHLEIIINYYRKDLDALYHHLSEVSYRQSKDPDKARRAINKIWKKLALPSPDWFKN